MIEGTVDFEGVPSISIDIAGRSWRAVIDTGFNGDLEIPKILWDHVRPRFIGQIRSLLAGGQMIDEDSYLVEIPFDGQTVVVEATFVPQLEILVGTRLLRRYCLQIDFVRRTVHLEQSK